jgi:hypothetical protein
MTTRKKAAKKAPAKKAAKKAVKKAAKKGMGPRRHRRADGTTGTGARHR